MFKGSKPTLTFKPGKPTLSNLLSWLTVE